MKTLAGVEALPPQESQKSQSASEVEVEPRPALPAGWERVRAESSGEILFLHQESLRCQRERPRVPDLWGKVDQLEEYQKLAQDLELLLQENN